jgi:putative ATP-binding cassette transporter
MTAIAERRQAEFVRQAMFYLAVFGASTAVTVVARFFEERLGLLWRDNLTRRSLNLYLKGAYCHLGTSGELPNPDQRIAEDIRAFAVSTLSFVLMAFNSSLTIIAFSGVMLSISPILAAATVLYAAFGSCATFLLGRPLIKLNFDQLDKEASFRATLVHVRENAESILLARREDALSARLIQQLDTLVANFRRIISTNRNVRFFTTGYNWMIQIIPILIIAPAYMAGRVEFGVITQSAAAFSTAVAAFSLVVTQFQSISSFAAVLARLSFMAEAFESAQTAPSQIQIVESEGPLAYEGLTLSSPTERALLLESLSVTIPFGSRVLVTGADTNAGMALFRATGWRLGHRQGAHCSPTRQPHSVSRTEALSTARLVAAGARACLRR